MAARVKMRNDRIIIHDARSNALHVSVELDGDAVTVQDVGLGHCPHTLANGAGRASTDAEIMLAEAVAKLRRELDAYTVPQSGVLAAIFSWLTILEKEADRLSESAQTALALLREDLDRIAASNA